MTVLYLCQLDPDQKIKGEPRVVGLLGRCVTRTDVEAWRFLPNVAGRQPSRRTWPTAEACIPRWARAGFTRLLDRDEFNAAIPALRGEESSS